MMDYISNFPGPDRETSILEVKNHIKKIPTFKNISDKYIYTTISNQFDIVTNFGKVRGSAAGWQVHERREIINKSKIKLKIMAYKKYRFKAIIKTLVYCNKQYFDTLEKFYAPGNEGMTTAYLEFEEHKQNINKNKT